MSDGRMAKALACLRRGCLLAEECMRQVGWLRDEAALEGRKNDADDLGFHHDCLLSRSEGLRRTLAGLEERRAICQEVQPCA